MSAKKQVESVPSCLQDMRLADWAEANEETPKNLDFAAFMEKFHGEALVKDWDCKIKLLTLAAGQGERPFREWPYELLNSNVLLHGHSGHFNDEAMHEPFRNDMDEGLKLHTRKIDIGKGDMIRNWIEAVGVEGEFVPNDRAAVREMAREMYQAEQQKEGKDVGGGRTMGTRTENTMSTFRKPAVGSFDLPKLTPAERALIFEHHGCFKCRQL